MNLVPSFALAISAICAQYNGTRYYDACLNALDKSTRQIGVRQQMDQAQDKVNEIVTRKVDGIVGQPVRDVVAVGGIVLNTARERKISFGLPTLGLASSVSNEVGVDSYKIVLQWNW